MDEFSQSVGKVLRETRLNRELTLYDVWAASGMRLTPSAVGSYERGERAISLERFCEIAATYRVPPEQLLFDIIEAVYPDARRSVVVDLDTLARQETFEARATSDFVHEVMARRQDFMTNRITLRSGDLDAIGAGVGLPSEVLIERLGSAARDRSRLTA